MIVAGAWAVQSFFAGIRTITDSRVCQVIFRPESYGSIFGIDGIVANLLGIAGGVMIPQVIDRINEGNGYGAVFALALLFLPGAVIFQRPDAFFKRRETQRGSYCENPDRLFFPCV